ncbi:hypothetical protein ACI39X_27870, partial [Klebsiella pneumoniae]|uniref:hypothetical protein n=1 Tax=Klebsiella pneumoniae TaxID=573 RepID=UPI003851F739
MTQSESQNPLALGATGVNVSVAKMFLADAVFGLTSAPDVTIPADCAESEGQNLPKVFLDFGVSESYA